MLWVVTINLLFGILYEKANFYEMKGYTGKEYRARKNISPIILCEQKRHNSRKPYQCTGNIQEGELMAKAGMYLKEY